VGIDSSAGTHSRIALIKERDQLLPGCMDYDRLLPDVWKQSHPEAIREYRVEERRDKVERKQFQAVRRLLAAGQPR
jgi:hypothetical protein